MNLPGPGPGRPKGSKNKVGKQVKDIIEEVTEHYKAEKMKEDLDSLRPVSRLHVMAKLWEFVAPKLQRTEIKGEITTGPKKIGIKKDDS